MAIDFPSNPILDQTFVVADKTFIFNGYGWMMVTVGGSTVAKAADTQSSAPKQRAR